MEIDIFEGEQQVYDQALSDAEAVKNGRALDPQKYVKLVNEYGKLLKQLRRSTRIADRVAIELHEDNLALLDQAHLDVLTGIYNRRFMEGSLKQIIKSLSRSGGELSLLMVDIDFFKFYNDTYGHNKGDICLRAIAQTIAGSLSRQDDFAARFGGEEFAVILPNTGQSGARFVAEKILGNVKALNWLHETSEIAGYVTVSIGVTTGSVDHTQGVDCYLKRADQALYMSKKSGRARYTFLNLDEVDA